MFDKLKEAIKSFTKSIVEKELTEKELDRYLWDFELRLISSDVASSVARSIVEDVKKRLVGQKVGRLTNVKEYLFNAIRESIRSVFPDSSINLVEIAKQRRKENLEAIKTGGRWKPIVVLFLGPNGSGKTTTIAKLAWKLKKNNLMPLLVAADTFRAGAIEQLEIHAERVGVPLMKREYGVDPASVAYDAIAHASSKKRDIVLIDTAGRLGSDMDLLQEMSKIARVTKPDYKILVVDALSGNDIANQAEMFSKHVGVDGNILTKLDADVKGGAAITLAYMTKAPIVYVGVGQGYDDLVEFNPDWFIEKIFS